MGGGTCPPSTLLSRRVGLSPRGRGNRHPLPPSGLEVRSIPAWAGEPNCSLYSLYGATVYPRVGGGTDTYPFWYSLAGGLSPRGRGNQLVCGSAEKALSGTVYPRVGGGTAVSNQSLYHCSQEVYPRVGGGTCFSNSTSCHLVARGLSPRGRGTIYNVEPQTDVGGLSPRGRGNPRRVGRSGVPSRSIPAWAGEPTGQLQLATPVILRYGLSPRGRGNRHVPVLVQSRGGSIPAWAGEPTRMGRRKSYRKVYPRVGGGTASVTNLATIARGLSPRGRGNRRQ